MPPQHAPKWVNLPLFWAVLTVIYVLPEFIFPAYKGPGAYVLGFLGLFVPIGLWTTLVLVERISGLVTTIDIPLAVRAVLVVAFLAAALFLGEKLLKRANLRTAPKIFAILGILLFLTFAVDMLTYQTWNSIYYFISGGVRF